MQIHKALVDPSKGWQNHPAVNMWRGYEYALCLYGLSICLEWQKRGYKDKQFEYFTLALVRIDGLSIDSAGMPFLQAVADPSPPWFGNEAFHASHRSNLLRKDPYWYGKFGWTERPGLPYVWPSKGEAVATQ